ncbi:MAG: hypothetical protein WC058_15450 [Phycisphaeraceae bacterium]
MTTTCACMTVWQVDRGDYWLTIPACRAAELCSCGWSVRLASQSTRPIRPVVFPGVQYDGDSTYVEKVCGVCGYPTQIRKVQ